MYSSGTEALKKEYYTSDIRKTAKQEEKEKRTRLKMISKARKQRLLLKRRIIAVLVLAASMSFLVLTRYTMIAKEYQNLNDLKGELSLEKAKIVEMQMAAEAGSDPKKIEQEAVRMGMRQPTKNQVKSISLGNTDNGEVLKTEKTNVFRAFINRVSVILEYLY